MSASFRGLRPSTLGMACASVRFYYRLFSFASLPLFFMWKKQVSIFDGSGLRSLALKYIVGSSRAFSNVCFGSITIVLWQTRARTSAYKLRVSGCRGWYFVNMLNSTAARTFLWVGPSSVPTICSCTVQFYVKTSIRKDIPDNTRHLVVISQGIQFITEFSMVDGVMLCWGPWKQHRWTCFYRSHL